MIVVVAFVVVVVALVVVVVVVVQAVVVVPSFDGFREFSRGKKGEECEMSLRTSGPDARLDRMSETCQPKCGLVVNTGGSRGKGQGSTDRVLGLPLISAQYLRHERSRDESASWDKAHIHKFNC